jgi:hypothetical protein
MSLLKILALLFALIAVACMSVALIGMATFVG